MKYGTLEQQYIVDPIKIENDNSTMSLHWKLSGWS